MSNSYSFYLVVDHTIDNAARTIESLSALSDSRTSVHQEHGNGISTFQITTADLVIATKIKLLFGAFIHHEDSGDA